MKLLKLFAMSVCVLFYFFRLFHLVGFRFVCFLFFYFFFLFSILAHSCMNNKEDLEIFFFSFSLLLSSAVEIVAVAEAAAASSSLAIPQTFQIQSKIDISTHT